MELDYVKLGKRIRKIRKEQGLSQETLAEKSDLSANHLSHIERANTKVALPTLIQIVNALEVTTDDVLCDSIIKAKIPYLNKINSLASDCDEKEIRLFCAVFETLKESYRDINKMENNS